MANSQGVDDIQSLFVNAQLLLQDNQFASAINIYQKILKRDPTFVDAWRYLALSYVQLNKLNDALLAFNQALLLKEDAILYMNVANLYKKMARFDEAILHYQKALMINPNYASAHNNLAGLFADIGDYDEALHHYKEALHSDPSFTLAHLNLGVFLFNNQDILAAKIQFKNVLAIDENNLSAQFYLGLLELNANNLSDAQNIFQNILKLYPEHVQSLLNLGVIFLKKKQDQMAIDYFTKVLVLDENNRDARNNLAATFIHNDRYENALMYYDSLLKEEPNNIEYLYNTGIAQMGLGHIQDAIKLFDEVLILDNKHFGALSNMAAIKMRMNDRNSALTLLERAIVVEPDNKTTKFMLRALKNKHTEIEPCKEYAQDLFDHYALYYDKHMQDTLKYNIPQKLWELLNKLAISDDGLEIFRALDLGCGTGLCGSILRPFAKYLLGVDISEKMLQIARSQNIYDKLIASDILDFLEKDVNLASISEPLEFDSSPQGLYSQNLYNLIVAADVLPYFGSLQDLFSKIKNRLGSGGIFIFTTEISQDKSWKIQESMRFCHSKVYILELCESLGYEIIYMNEIQARKQEDRYIDEILCAVKM